MEWEVKMASNKKDRGCSTEVSLRKGLVLAGIGVPHLCNDLEYGLGLQCTSPLKEKGFFFLYPSFS